MGGHDHPAILGQFDDDRPQRVEVVGVDVSGRLVEQQQRCVAQPGTGQRQAGSLTGRQPKAVVAELRVQPLTLGKCRPQPHRSQRLLAGRLARLGRTQAKHVDHRAGQNEWALGGQVGSVGDDRPRGRGTNAGDQVQQRALAAARLPGQCGQAGTGRGGEAGTVENVGAVRVAEGHPVDEHPVRSTGISLGLRDIGTGRVDDLRCPFGSGRGGNLVPGLHGIPVGIEVGPNGVEYCGAVGRVVKFLAHPPHRPVGLGRQQNGGEPNVQVHRPVGQPEAHRHRHHRHRDRGQQLEGGRRQEGGAQGADRRPAVNVTDRSDVGDLVVGPAVGDQGGQAPHDIEEMAGHGVHRTPAPSGLRLGVQADQSGEERQQRQREHQDDGAPEVDPEQHEHGEHRDDRSRHQRREILGDVGLDALRPRPGQRHRLGGRGAPLGRAGNPAPQQP